MLNPLKYESNIKIKNIPIQWISKFELYYPDLPQFPIVYIHVVKENHRVYGFPVSFSVKITTSKTCDVDILFLSNIDIDSNEKIKRAVGHELEERFGSCDRVSLKEIIKGCGGNREYEQFFVELWKYVSKAYGDTIPYGKFYEEIFSMVRFVSAWNPKTGRQSEMRMLYNFLSIFGEPIEIQGKWDFLEFFLMPTYNDVKKKDFSDFPKFKNLFTAIEKIWNIYFRIVTEIDNVKIKTMAKSWPAAKDDFINSVTYPLFLRKKLSLDERLAIERLVDAFNRHSWRASFFIWSIMTIFEKDYYLWDKNFFIKFYTQNRKGVGLSEKAVACFLQQGFKNNEVIPIDTWVESFYENALGIMDKKVFFNTFDNLGKIERAIWLAAQSKKTNIKTFFDMLWCIRFGDTGNTELRGPNPISCYECKLMIKCPGFQKIKNELVLVKNKTKVVLDKKFISSPQIIKEAVKKGCSFICLTEKKVPKKIFINRNGKFKLIDEFSGYILKDQKLKKDNTFLTVEKLIAELPHFLKNEKR
ncbi:hypothetical protein ACFLYY_01595 [Patescibacteria group bacterium]